MTRNEEYALLRRRALEFIGKIVHHCGYEYVENNITNILTEVDQVDDD